MARQKKPLTWSQVAVANAGFRDGLRAIQFAMEWGFTSAFLGRDPETIDEYAEVAEVSRAKAFRDQQAFRKAFPDLDGPRDFIDRTSGQQQFDEFMAAARELGKARKNAAAFVFDLGAMPYSPAS